MKTKKYLFMALLTLVAVITAWSAYTYSEGTLFKGNFFDLFNPGSSENLDIVIEMPANDNEDYSYKHPIMFRARIRNMANIKSLSDHNLRFTWESDRQGVIGKGMEFEKLLSKGKHHITCTVSDGNGNRGKTEKDINIINTPPEISITSPTPLSEIKKGTPILLEAQVSDKEESTIPDVAISWNCNLNGELGRGKSITIDSLSVGTHKITATVKDSEGEESSAKINIIVK